MLTGEWLNSLHTLLLKLVETGGPVVAILLVLSIIALSIILLKWFQFASLRIDSVNQVKRALQDWQQGRTEAALKRLQNRRQPTAQVVYAAMQGLYQPQLNEALLREEIQRIASDYLEQLRSYLRVLELIATLSPLLGLLGTVLGMIDAFQQLEAAGSQVDPAILSGGIWTALLTTAVGLGVAIATILAHGWLERSVERCGHLMEDTVTQVFTRRPVSTTDRTVTSDKLHYAT